MYTHSRSYYTPQDDKLDGVGDLMSKFSLDVLERRVVSHTGTEDPDVLLGAVFGEDAALTRVGGDILASHLDPIVGAIREIGWLAVHVTCNDIAATGIPPRVDPAARPGT